MEALLINVKYLPKSFILWRQSALSASTKAGYVLYLSCLGVVMSSVCLSRVGYGTINFPDWGGHPGKLPTSWGARPGSEAAAKFDPIKSDQWSLNQSLFIYGCL